MTGDIGETAPPALSVETPDISGIAVATVTPSDVLAQSLGAWLTETHCKVLGNWHGVDIGLISELLRAQSAVVLLDYAFLLNQGGKYLERLSQLGASIKTLVIAESLTDKMKCEILWAGGHGYLAVAQLGKHLRKAIYETAGGGQWFERHILFECTHDVSRAAAPEKNQSTDTRHARVTENLTRREQHVVTLVGLGLRNKEIARKLEISEKTVKLHLNRIYRKLGISSRLQLGVSLGPIMPDLSNMQNRAPQRPPKPGRTIK